MTGAGEEAKKPRFAASCAERPRARPRAGAAHARRRAQRRCLRFGNPRLERGAGVGKLVYFDCFSGVAGDMSVAALIDLGVPLEVVQGAIAAVGIEGVAVDVLSAQTGAIGGVRFSVEVRGEHPSAATPRSCDCSTKPASTRHPRPRAAIFRRLAEAEAFVHRTPLEAVTFHEVGAVDAIADIVGAAAALAFLGADLICSRCPWGTALSSAATACCRYQHRRPWPAARCSDLRRGHRSRARHATGAAIVASQAVRFERWPSLVPLAIGWGAGIRQLPDRPNALRAVLGDAVAAPAKSPDARACRPERTGALVRPNDWAYQVIPNPKRAASPNREKY